MALAITGTASISHSDFGEDVNSIKVLYSLTGNYKGADVKKLGVKWSGDNLMSFNPKEGNWLAAPPKYSGDTTSDVNAPYYPWVNKADKDLEDTYLANTNDKTKLTLEFTKDHWTEHFNSIDPANPHVDPEEVVKVEVSAFDTAGVQGAATFSTTFNNASLPADDSYIMKAGVPVNGADNHTPVYVVLEDDVPPVTQIITPFYSTYPSPRRDYSHRIVYSGDSSFFWDSGQDEVYDNLNVTNNYFEATLSVHDWAPHADYTGYITVSATGTVTHHDFTVSDEGVDTVVAQDGYLIFIEYHTGTAVSIRVLQASESHLIVNAENKAIRTHGNDD